MCLCCHTQLGNITLKKQKKIRLKESRKGKKKYILPGMEGKRDHIVKWLETLEQDGLTRYIISAEMKVSGNNKIEILATREKCSYLEAVPLSLLVMG